MAPQGQGSPQAVAQQAVRRSLGVMAVVMVVKGPWVYACQGVDPHPGYHPLRSALPPDTEVWRVAVVGLEWR